MGRLPEPAHRKCYQSMEYQCRFGHSQWRSDDGRYSHTEQSNLSQIVLTTGTLNANGGISIAGTNTLTKVIIMSGGASTINLKELFPARPTQR